MIGYTQLPNGIKLYAMPCEQKSVGSISVTFPYGANMEKEHEKGLAHLLEHLLFDCTSLSQNDFNRKTAQIGATSNAFTAANLLSFYIHASTSKLQDAAQLLLMMMTEFNLTQQILDNERNVVLAEISDYENDPAAVFFDRYYKKCLPGSVCAMNPLGSREKLKALSVEDITSFHDDIITTDKMSVVVSAPESFLQTEDMQKITDMLKAVPETVCRRTPAAFSMENVSMEPYTERSGKVEEITQSMFFTMPKDRASNWYMHSLLSKSMASYLFTKLRVEDSLSYGVSGWVEQPDSVYFISVDHPDDKEISRRVRDVLRSVIPYLKNLSEEDFSMYHEAVIARSDIEAAGLMYNTEDLQRLMVYGETYGSYTHDLIRDLTYAEFKDYTAKLPASGAFAKLLPETSADTDASDAAEPLRVSKSFRPLTQNSGKDKN